MTKKLTPEERAARAAARKTSQPTKAEGPAQEADAAATHEVPDPQPADDKMTAAVPQQSADDPTNLQESNDPSGAELSGQEPARTSAEKKEDMPLSPATAYADSPGELAARAAETEVVPTTEQPRPASDGLTAKGRQILEEYPAAEAVYMTSNGFGFFREQDARNHAATLRDKTLTIVKRK